jgi:HK97 family phage major capsid protein
MGAIMTNNQIVKAAAIQTSSLTNGLLNPEQARKFIQQTFEATNLGKLVRHEMRVAKTGEIDKIGIAKRLLRKKTEGMDDGYRAGVKTGAINYATTAVRLPWEITEETLRENIEGQNLESIITNLMTKQMGVDTEDLYINGDTSVSTSDPDHDFLYINDGWRKQLLAGSHIYDAQSDSDMSLDIFYKTMQKLPNKYNNGNLRWLMSPRRAQEWELYLLKKIINQGGAVPDSIYTAPAKIPTVEVPSLDDDTIILTDPKNLIVVNTYDVKIRKTVEGKEAIMQDKRFYVIHFDFDPVIEELDAAAIIKNLPSLS